MTHYRFVEAAVFLLPSVGYRVAPSSVTFGDSFPPGGSRWTWLGTQRTTSFCQDCSRAAGHNDSLPLGGKVGRRKPGRMRGRSRTQRGRRISGALSSRRGGEIPSIAPLGTGSPPHQAPSVPASPQGEAAGGGRVSDVLPHSARIAPARQAT